MATKVDELEVLIRANTAELKSGLKQTQNQVSDFGKSIGKMGSGISAGAIALGGIISSVFMKAFQAVSSEMDAAISRLDTLNNFPRVMSNLGIEAGLSSQAINKLSDDLRGLPTNLSDAVSAVQRLTAVNNNLAYSTDAFLALNNAILAGGAPAQLQATAIEQISQAYAKGKPDMMEWRTIMQAMPAQISQIAMAMGTTSTALGEGLRNGSISMNDFMNTIMKLNKEGVAGFQSFTDQAKNSTGGVATSITNLRIAIQRGIADIMNVIGQSNISGFINGIASAIGTAANYIAAFVKILKQAFAWVHALFGGGGGSTTEAVKETSSGIEGMASAVGGVSDNLDKATGSAKKLKHQLAGFDEMNVLQEQTQSGGGSGSGGSGGGGGINVGDYKWDTSGLTGGVDKVEKAFKDLKNFLNKIFGKIDFDKLGKAFQRFYEDAKKFIEPIGKILSDVWNDYLLPFITWAGNDLVPAFLNALGGAINFLGSVLGATWEALKPFINDFLVPIAQWTGGIIVNVLNWIGDALRGLAGNKDVINTIAQGLKLLIETLAAYETIKLATTAFNQLSSAFIVLSGQSQMVTQPMSALMFQVGASTNNMNMMTQAVGVAGTATTSLGTIMKTVGETVFSPMTITMLGLVAAIEAIQVATEYMKLKDMEAAVAAKELDNKFFDQTETVQELNNAVQAQIDLKNELKDIEKTLADATLNLMSAQDKERQSRETAEVVAREFGMTIDEAKDYVDGLDVASGNLTESDRKLIETIMKLESAEGNVRIAEDKVTEAKNKQSEASEKLKNQALKEWGMAKQNELQSKINAEKYDEVADALINLKNETVKYTDENGKELTISKQDVANYVDFVGDNLGKMETNQSAVWKGVWEAAGSSTDKIKESLNGLRQAAESSGVNWGDGLVKGINAKRNDVYWASYNLGKAAVQGEKDATNTHSPSKIAQQLGGFFGQGLVLGIDSEINSVKNASEQLGYAILKPLDMVNDFELAPIDFNSRLNTQFGDMIDSETEIDMRETPVHVVVNVGEDTLIDKVINGINDISNLENKNVLYV